MHVCGMLWWTCKLTTVKSCPDFGDVPFLIVMTEGSDYFVWLVFGV